MIALRCTARLLKALKGAPVAKVPPAQNRLGEWTANLVRVGRLQLVIAVSERTRLGLVIDAAPYASIPPRLMLQLARALMWLEVPGSLITEEVASSQPLVAARTNSPSLLGALNQFTFMAEAHILHGGASNALDLTRHLAQMVVIRPAHIGFPCDRVREAFGLPPRMHDRLRRVERIEEAEGQPQSIPMPTHGDPRVH